MNEELAAATYRQTLDLDMDVIAGIADEWPLGQRVRKKGHSEWQGPIVGYYSTEQTPAGVCVMSEFHRNTVQIYPCTALEKI